MLLIEGSVRGGRGDAHRKACVCVWVCTYLYDCSVHRLVCACGSAHVPFYTCVGVCNWLQRLRFYQSDSITARRPGSRPVIANNQTDRQPKTNYNTAHISN